MLKAAFVQGMLAKDEFDLRVGQVLASRTYAELAALTADLPAGLTAAQPPNPAQAKGGQPILRPGQIVTGATMLYAGAWLAAVFSPDGAAAGLVFLGGLVYLCLLAIAMAVALENRQQKRSGGTLRPGQAPGAGGQALRRLPPANPSGQLPPVDPRHRPTAQAVLTRRPGRRHQFSVTGQVTARSRQGRLRPARDCGSGTPQPRQEINARTTGISSAENGFQRLCMS